MRSFALVLLLAVTFFPAPVSAHARLLSPVPRMRLTSKVPPCGAPRTAAPHLFTAGEEIEVSWEEYIDHPGYYRLLFSPEADRNFVVLLDSIPDKYPPGGSSVALYSVRVKLPPTPCENGTLQLIQVMTENPQAPSLYYSCADVRLLAPSVKAFRRGDANLDGSTDLSDAVTGLEHLFRGGPALECRDAADANDDGRIDLSDPIGTLIRLFRGSSGEPLPLPGECGLDPTGDLLDCADYPACG